jgi:hypothetical protein
VARISGTASDRLWGADNFADPAVDNRIDPMTQEITILAGVEFGDGGPIVLSVAAGDGIDHAAQQPFIERELHDGARELLQIGEFDPFREAADLPASQHTSLDPHPLAYQFAVGQQLEAAQDPSRCVMRITLQKII